LEFARGVFLKKLTRTGEPMPFSPATQVERGDVMTLVGAARDVSARPRSSATPIARQ
jgi:hypothetical protein